MTVRRSMQSTTPAGQPDEESDLMPQVRPPDSLTEYAVEVLRSELLTGRLRPGARLTADGTAERLGISHIPVREALRFLEAQGHLVLDARRGARVAPTSDAEAEDIYLTRAMLEAEANRLGIPRLTPDDDDRLRELIRRMEAAAKAGDLQAYRAHNRTFHFIPFERSGRPWLVRFLRILWDAAARYQAPLFVGRAWRVKHPGHHRVLLDAYLKRDVDRANHVMAEHRAWLLASTSQQSDEHGVPVGQAHVHAVPPMAAKAVRRGRKRGD